MEDSRIKSSKNLAIFYTSFSRNPPPTSSFSRLAKMLLKSGASWSLGASPPLGALGVATFLLFSWPAFDGNVGKNSVDFGRGFSSK